MDMIHYTASVSHYTLVLKNIVLDMLKIDL